MSSRQWSFLSVIQFPKSIRSWTAQSHNPLPKQRSQFIRCRLLRRTRQLAKQGIDATCVLSDIRMSHQKRMQDIQQALRRLSPVSIPRCCCRLCCYLSQKHICFKYKVVDTNTIHNLYIYITKDASYTSRNPKYMHMFLCKCVYVDMCIKLKGAIRPGSAHWFQISSTLYNVSWLLRKEWMST